MDNSQYARILNEIADLYKIKDANRYKIRAYENAARSIDNAADSIDERIENDTVGRIKGIGSSIADDLRQIHHDGTCQAHAELVDELDPGLLDILNIQGLGPKRVATIYHELGVHDLAGIKQAAEAHDIQGLSGLGQKTESKILAEIDRLERYAGRTPLPQARRVATSIRDALGDLEVVGRIEIAGSIRRGRETIGDVDLLVTTDEPAEVTDAFVSLNEVDEVLASGPTKTSVRLIDGLQVDLRVVDEPLFGSALHYFTGSKNHHIQLRTRAKRRDLKISEYGVFRDAEDTPIASRTEKEVFEAVGLPYIAPEIREGRGEIEAAADDRLPELIDLSEVRGDLHMHTVETDGKASIADMARAARSLGWSYIAITDHSQAVTVANGMTPRRFEAHIDRIDRVNDTIDDIEILSGIEVDILEDGALDMDHPLLTACDWVVASVHSYFHMDAAEMTDRLVAAISTGLVSEMGHPTGRILGGRDGYSYDFDAVLEAVVDHGVAMELNGSTGRIDLNADNARKAKARGAKLVLGSDAHSPGGLRSLRWAVEQARRGWLSADDVLNTRPVDDLLAAVRPTVDP